MRSVLLNCIGFEWDDGNKDKNWTKHGVSEIECEEPFFNEPIVVTDDASHSTDERRFYLLGKTNEERLLMVVFTIRGDHIRVISARDMSKKERVIFHEAT